MGGSKPKAPKPLPPPPPPPPVVAPVTSEDDNVKSAAEGERKRIRSQKGRQGSQLLASTSNATERKNLLG